MGLAESPQDAASQSLTAATTAGSGPSSPVVVNPENPLVNRLTQGLEECDWDQLQAKYTDAMDEHSRVEEDLRMETAKLLEVTPSIR